MARTAGKSPYKYRTATSRWRSSARDGPGVATAVARLGKRIRELRASANLTQERAADAAKLDHKHWQDIESGRTNPTVATLVGVARALGVELRDLFDEP